MSWETQSKGNGRTASQEIINSRGGRRKAREEGCEALDKVKNWEEWEEGVEYKRMFIKFMIANSTEGYVTGR